METRTVFMILGFLVLGIFLFGCAQSKPAENDTNQTPSLTCNDYCPTQTRMQCNGTWQISGTYPNCNCQFICDKTENKTNQSVGPALPMSASIDISNYKFSPDTIEIAKGATVTWINKDGTPHTLVADNESFNSGMVYAGSSYNYTFDTAGNYSYHCGIHTSMKGTVVVK